MATREHYMKLAIKSAIAGITRKEGGPFGAAIVDKNGKLLAVAHNTVWKSCDSTAHAEVNAIRKACKKLGTIDLTGCTIYSTAEPCPMCFTAIHWARIRDIYFGATIEDAAHYGFHEFKIHNLKLKMLGHLKTKITPAFMRNECLVPFEKWKKMNGKTY